MGYGIVRAIESLTGRPEPDFAVPDDVRYGDITNEYPSPGEETASRGSRANSPEAETYDREQYSGVEEVSGARLDSIEDRLIRLENAQQRENSFLTWEDLENELDRRFEIQDRAVQSLRGMVAHTDELLEQVIESVDSINVPA